MLSRDLPLGTKLKFVGPTNPSYHDDYGLRLGDVGVIDYIDTDDADMTYRVKFPCRDWGVWIGNHHLALVETVPEEPELCGWKDRALKAEKELKEFKEALKTLSEG